MALLALRGAALSAQQPSRPSASPAGSDETPVDACVIAPLEQLRFLIAAGFGRAVPISRTVESDRVIISSLGIRGVTCSPMRADLEAEVRRLPGNGRTSDSASAVVHFVASMAGRARFRADTTKQPRTASGLSTASLCVRDIEVTRSDARSGGGTAIDNARARGWLADALREQCFDITSLVYVYLQRGGTLLPPR